MSVAALAPARPVLSHRRTLLMVGGVGSGMFLTGLMQSIVTVALPTIVRDLGGFEGLHWLMIGYILAQTATIPLWGRLGDLYGRRRTFQVAIVVFVGASALSGLATSLLHLIGFRVLQGIGGAGIVASAFAILADVLTPRSRGRYQGYMVAITMVASVAGPFVGGFLVDNVGWRSVFYINVPVGLAALFVSNRAIPHLHATRTEPARFDILGSALLVSGVSSLMLVTTWLDGGKVWESATAQLLAVTGVVLLVWFFAHEARTPEPVLPLRLFRMPGVALLLACGFMLGLVMYPAVLFVPTFLQTVVGTTATSSGVMLLPLVGGVTLASFVCGILMSRTGRYRVFLIVGSSLMTTGYALLTRLTADAEPWHVLAISPVIGLGIGAISPTLTVAVQNAVDRGDLGVATSTLQFVRMLGMALGTAAYGAVFNVALAAELSGRVRSGALPAAAATLRRDPRVLDTASPAVRDVVTNAFADAIHLVFVGIVPLALVVVAMSFVLRERPLTDDIDEVAEVAVAAAE